VRCTSCGRRPRVGWTARQSAPCTDGYAMPVRRSAPSPGHRKCPEGHRVDRCWQSSIRDRPCRPIARRTWASTSSSCRKARAASSMLRVRVVCCVGLAVLRGVPVPPRSVNEESVDGGSGRQRGLEVVNNAVSFPVSLFRKLRLQLRASPAWTDDVIGAEALKSMRYADILVQAGRARGAAEALGSSLAASSPGSSL
jgi:hypothetical protein